MVVFQIRLERQYFGIILTKIAPMLKHQLQVKLKNLLGRINFSFLRNLRNWILHCRKQSIRNKMITLMFLKKCQRKKKRIASKKIFAEIKRVYKEMFTLNLKRFSALAHRLKISDLLCVIKYARKMKKHIPQRLKPNQKNSKQYQKVKHNPQVSICEKVAHEKIGSEIQNLKNLHDEDSRQKQVYPQADKIEGEHINHNSVNTQQITLKQLTNNSQLFNTTFSSQSKQYSLISKQQTQIQFTYFIDKQQNLEIEYQKKIVQSQISERQNLHIGNSLGLNSQNNTINTQSASNIFSSKKKNNAQRQIQIFGLLNQSNKKNDNCSLDSSYTLQQPKEPVIMQNYQLPLKIQEQIFSNKSNVSKLERQQTNFQTKQQEKQSQFTLESNEILLDYLDRVIFVTIHDDIIVIDSIDFLNNFSESMNLFPICQKSTQDKLKNSDSSENSYCIDHFFNRLFYYWQISFPLKFSLEKPQKIERSIKERRFRLQNKELWRVHIFQRFLLKRNYFNNFLNDNRQSRIKRQN